MQAEPQRQGYPRRFPQLGRFLRTLTAAVTLYLAVAAMRAPSSSTTWLDAWVEAVAVGVAAGLVAVWVFRARSPGGGRIARTVGGLAIVSIAAGWLAPLVRSRRRGGF